DEETAEQGAADSGDSEDGAQRAEVFAALVGWHDVGDYRLRENHESATAQALSGPETHEGPEVAREGAPDRGESEDGNGDEKQVSPAQDVTELAIDRHDYRGGEKVGGGDPRLV